MTITSHIHIGLSAWQASHSYSIGNRVISSGNAYQAISAGVSGTTAPSGTSADFYDGAVHWKYLSSAAVTSLAQWEASIPSTLTDNYVGLLWNDSAITTTDGVPFLTIGSSTNPRTTGSYTITLACAPGESYRDKLLGNNTALAFNTANGVSFTLPASGAGYSNYFDIWTSNVVFDGLQFRDPYSTSNSSIINVNASTVFTIQNCILDGYAQPNGAAIMASAASMHVGNCLVVDRQATGLDGVAIYGGDNDATSRLVNTTIVRINPTNGSEGLACGFIVNNAAAIVRNSILCGYTSPVGGLGSAVLVDHTATSASSFPNATDNGSNTFSISVANQFLSASTNFRLKAGSSGVSGGIVDTTDIPLANDIIGYSRPQGLVWGRGAAEFSSQFVARAAIGPLAASGGIATANNLATAVSIGTISAASALIQNDSIVATVSLGAMSVMASANLSNAASIAATIGTFSASSTLSLFDNISATITILSPFVTIAIAQGTTASGSSSIGVFSAIGAAALLNPVNAAVSLGSISSASSLGQTGFASALGTFSLQTAGQITPSNILASATVTVPLVGLIAIRQEDNASALLNLSLTPVVTSYQSAQTTASATLQIALAGTARQEEQLSFVGRLSPTAVVTAQQTDTVTATVNLSPIALSSGMSPSYLASAVINLGPLVGTASGYQTSIASSALPFAISLAATMTNPIPLSAQASIGAISSVISTAPTIPLSATVNIGTISLTPVQLLQAGDVSGVASLVISGQGALTNPFPLVGTASVPSISASGVFGNTFALAANALGQLPALTAQITVTQFDLASASVQMGFTVQGHFVSAPRLRVSQTASEVLTAGGTLRVSQAATEILSSGGALRVSQTAIEVLAQSPPPSNARISQIMTEALTIGTPRALVSQSVQEVLTGGSGAQNVRISQVITAILTGGTTNQNVRMSQIVLEALVSAVPLEITSETFFMV